METSNTAENLARGRTVAAINDGWFFLRGRAQRRWLAGWDGPGEEVELPHCWNALDTFRPGVRSYRGHGSYRRAISAADVCLAGQRKWFLVAGGFYGTGDVWWDGRRIAWVDGMYLGFCLDLTERVRDGRTHIVALRLTNDCRRWVLPGIRDPDFILHGGLAGGMSVECAPLFRILESTVRIEICGELDCAAGVRARLAICNDSVWPLSGRVIMEVKDGSGSGVARSETSDMEVAPRTRRDAEVSAVVESPRLWSPDRPDLYVLSLTLADSAGAWDRVERRIGIRRAEFRPWEGFFLNNERLVLRGCNRHEAMPGFGNAMPAALHRRDVAEMKKMGLNFVRLSHYPQSEAFLDACDEQGLLVYAEIASWKTARGGWWLKNAAEQLKRMIARDGHRPSIIAWGIGNEARARRPYLALRNVARSMDPGRPVAYAENHLHRARRARTLGIPDVWGVNYEIESAGDGAAASGMKCAIVTECSNAPDSARDNPVELIRQVETIEKDLRLIENLKGVAGFALWCFADYATERKDRWRRFSGVVDAWRVWKPAAFLLAAMHSPVAVLFLFCDWSESKPAGKRTAHVFTNCDEVVVLRNGAEAVRLKGAPHVSVGIDFEPGVLAARGVRGGEICEASCESFGEARRLSLEIEGNLEAGGDPVAVWVRALDTRGRVARDWSGEVVVRSAGAARAVPHFEGNIVSVAAGEGRLFVAPGEAPGSVSVAVSDRSGRLEPASVEIPVSVGGMQG